jgi:hypothetical protein
LLLLKKVSLAIKYFIRDEKRHNLYVYDIGYPHLLHR